MNEEHYILFDQYLQDELTVEEKNNFEKQLAQDAELVSAFEAFKIANFQLENKFGNEEGREAFKQNLKSISDSHFNKKETKVISFKPWYYTVAAAAVILIGLFFFDYNSAPAFADFDHPEQASFTQRGDVNEALKQAETTFNARKYKEAIPFFETALKETNSPEIEYFYGVSLLEESQYAKAEGVFNKLKTGTSVYKDKALWNLALSKLKQKKYKACKEILQNISQDYENYDDVEQLLEQLN